MTELPDWTPLMPAVALPMEETVKADIAKAFPNISAEDVNKVIEELRGDQLYINSRYQVAVRAHEDRITHLSIKRLDKAPMGPEKYRDFMRIKDELIGPEYEAVELYPARSREVDTANQYHLWVFHVPDYKLPFGFDHGRNVVEHDYVSAKQQPFEKDQPK